MNLLEYDKKHIWHPYTSATRPLPVYQVKEAHGCVLTLEDGRQLVDGMSSWWAAIHGYNHPVLNKAIEQQLQSMAHVMFGGLTHEPAILLAKQLIEITPELLQHVFYCDSGSVAVEVAMKMALQYWQSKKVTSKTNFATVRKGYHGDTWHAMSVCDPLTGMHHIFGSNLPQYYFAKQPLTRFDDPWDEQDISSMEIILQKHGHEIAAVIIEPVVQGAGGMWFYSPNYLVRLRELCDMYDVLLIADEIATGFGRTGKMFACNHAKITPDIMCLGKALTGGYMSFAATLATAKVAAAISDGDPGVFMHGPTFMANPLACSVASASLLLLRSSKWEMQIQHIEDQMFRELEPCRISANVADVRVLGAIGVVEMYDFVDLQAIQSKFVEMGVWIRPFGKLIYLMPPFIISSSELTQLTNAVCEVVK